MGYLEHFGLRTLPFTMSNPRALYYLHGRRHRIADAESNPDLLGFECHEHERGRTHGQLWAAALEPLLARLREQGEAAWAGIVSEYDQILPCTQHCVRGKNELVRHGRVVSEAFAIQDKRCVSGIV